MKAIFDIEANALLRELHTIHCLVFKNEEGIHVFRNNDKESSVLKGVKKLFSEHSLIIGHNIQAFDIPAIQKVWPDSVPFTEVTPVYDTLIASRIAFSERFEHSLGSWGKDLKCLKGDFKGPWDKWTQEMEDYCIQDVLLNEKVYDFLSKQNIPERALALEHKFAMLMDAQMAHGINFDVGEAVSLKKQLEKEISEIETALKEQHSGKDKVVEFTPKVNNTTRGYVKGHTIEKRTHIPFNPTSRDQVADFLSSKYGWNPVERTDTGKAKITGDILNELTYPEAEHLSKLFDAKKLHSQLYGGEGGWLKKVSGNRIYGRINHNGAITGRCTHSSPNLAQVPRVTSYRGAEARSLFLPDTGHVLVGVDASGIELRNLAHYLHKYDNGAYTRTILTGDIHTKNQKDAGLETRDQAKRFIYAFNYGAGDELLGDIISPEASKLMKKLLGAEARKKFLANNPAVSTLKRQLEITIGSRGYLHGLDGRRLPVREKYMALNVLLQGAGAVIMKQAPILLWERATAEGIAWKHAFPLLHIHDEYQMSCHPDYAERLKELGIQAIRDAGEMFNFKCPLDGEGKIGKNWKETH